MSCDRSSTVLYQQIVIESNSNCAFFRPHFLSYKNTDASFGGHGARSAVVLDGGGAGCKEAFYKFML